MKTLPLRSSHALHFIINYHQIIRHNSAPYRVAEKTSTSKLWRWAHPFRSEQDDISWQRTWMSHSPPLNHTRNKICSYSILLDEGWT